MTTPTGTSAVTGRRRRRRALAAHVLLYLAANLIAATWDGSFPIAVLTGDTPLPAAFENFNGEDLPRISLYVTRFWTLLLVLDVVWTAVVESGRTRSAQ